MGRYPGALNTFNTVREAREAMAEMLNCKTKEVKQCISKNLLYQTMVKLNSNL